MTSSSITPITTSERLQTIDILRGFALLGILIVNFTVDSAQLGPMAGWTGVGDQFAYWFIRFFLDDKFQTIFCFLFGLGFAIQMQRAADRQSSFVWLFVRRMIALYLIGTLIYIFSGQAYFVLPYYAIVGILLLLFRKFPIKFIPVLVLLLILIPWTRSTIKAVNKEQVVRDHASIDSVLLDKCTGVYLTNFPSLLFPHSYSIITRKKDTLFFESMYSKSRLYSKSASEFASGLTMYSFNQESSGRFEKLNFYAYGRNVYGTRIEIDPQEAVKKLAEQKVLRKEAAKKQISYPQFIKWNIISFRDSIRYWSWEIFIWGGYAISYVLVLFLLGMYAGRRRLFNDVHGNQLFFRKVMKWGLLFGTLGISISIGTSIWEYIQGDNWKPFSAIVSQLIELSWTLGIIIMAFGYIAALTLLLEKGQWKKHLSFLSVVGRMGLTCYILHIIAYVLIFIKMDWCLGLGDKTGGLYRLLLALGVYVLLYFISRLWSKYFRMGPFEWIWRSITYWKWQPMKKKETIQTTQLA